jgi:NAD(P)-dependent dehydrogenase (short-subunit alcohol dehydrogenase family)
VTTSPGTSTRTQVRTAGGLPVRFVRRGAPAPGEPVPSPASTAPAGRTARTRLTVDDAWCEALFASALQFGTNHLGPFALTGLLLEQMLPVPGSRVVTVSSIAHRIRARINFGDLQGQRSYSRLGAYSQSKLANLMFTYELARRLSRAGTTIAAAAHPGLAATELSRYTPAIAAFSYALVSQQAAMGALPVLRAATDPGVLGGQYYGPRGLFGARGYPELAHSSRRSRDAALQRRLWAVSEELTGVTFPV